MIHVGDIHVADLGDERRWPVLVMSNDRFHRTSQRRLVAPGLQVGDDEVLPPWHIRIGEYVYAVDLLRSVPASRLLDRVDRAPSVDIERARRALRQIT